MCIAYGLFALSKHKFISMYNILGISNGVMPPVFFGMRYCGEWLLVNDPKR